MRFFLFIIFLFLFSCSNKVTQVYICGDHPCVNKKEMKEYFDNNISIEVFTIIPDKENKKNFTLVDLNLMKDGDSKDKKKSKNLSSVKSKEDVKKIIKKRKKLAKLKLKENKAKGQKKTDKISKIKPKNVFKGKKKTARNSEILVIKFKSIFITSFHLIILIIITTTYHTINISNIPRSLDFLEFTSN